MKFGSRKCRPDERRPGPRLRAAAADCEGRGRASLVESPDATGRYRTVGQCLPPWQIELSLSAPRARGCERVTDERRRDAESGAGVPRSRSAIPPPDRQKLAEIAKAGGGAMNDGPLRNVVAVSSRSRKSTKFATSSSGFWAIRTITTTRWPLDVPRVFATLISERGLLRKWPGGLTWHDESSPPIDTDATAKRREMHRSSDPYRCPSVFYRWA